MSDPTTVAGWWESRYAEADTIWSGRVNPALADITSGFTPGSALDLGCGEGADALWLVQRGWRVMGVDVSATAIARARAAAAATGMSEDRARFLVADLAGWTTDERFDLVAASFLQSWPVVIPRDDILRRAADLVAPGGHLLVVAHAGAPPWSDADIPREYRFPSPEGDLAALELDPAVWSVLVSETRTRIAPARPGHQHHGDLEVLDGIVLVQRRGRAGEPGAEVG